MIYAAEIEAGWPDDSWTTYIIPRYSNMQGKYKDSLFYQRPLTDKLLEMYNMINLYERLTILISKLENSTFSREKKIEELKECREKVKKTIDLLNKNGKLLNHRDFPPGSIYHLKTGWRYINITSTYKTRFSRKRALKECDAIIRKYETKEEKKDEEFQKQIKEAMGSVEKKEEKVKPPISFEKEEEPSTEVKEEEKKRRREKNSN